MSTDFYYKYTVESVFYLNHICIQYNKCTTTNKLNYYGQKHVMWNYKKVVSAVVAICYSSDDITWINGSRATLCFKAHIYENSSYS